MSFFAAVGEFFKAAFHAFMEAKLITQIQITLTAATLAVGVKGFMQAKNMLAKGQDILANKTSMGGKIGIIYGTRRVGAQIIYMDVNSNDSRDMYVVYALSVGECDEIIGSTIELDGNPLTDSARFRNGGYIGSDKISSGSGSLNTVSQNGTNSLNLTAGTFGTDPTAKYRYVMNLHHGAASQTADPMLVASMSNWTTSHRLDGICYIVAHYGYDKEGMWRGVPQLTVQVRGKKVFDPRDNTQTFGTVSTYKHSDNPALCFLDYITNDEYGKGLTSSQINMSTFTAAANVCDTQVDQPYFNGSAQSLTWSGVTGDDFITVLGSGNVNLIWFQMKVAELFSLFDANGNGVLSDVEIKDIYRSQFYDENEDFRVYINAVLGSTYAQQAGSSLLKVKRFHCNGYIDANKNVMDNAKELLANMRGIFLYIDGKYELSIEDTGSSTFSITDNHIIAESGIGVDYGNKDKKANKVIVEFFNANKKYELDTATVLHTSSPYTADDGGEVLEVKAEFPLISDPYIAYNMAKAILTRSRNQTAIQFLGTPEMYKLNVGDIVDLTYAGLGFNGKVCRVEALELQTNGLVAVSLIEYFDVYTWEVPPQEAAEGLANLPSAYAVKAPTGLSFTDSNSSSTGRPFLSWNEPTDFPDYQYRVNVVDSSNNQVTNKIVDTENCDLNFVKTGSNYVASVSSLNTLGVESSPATLTFSVGDQPVVSVDLRDGSVLEAKLADAAVSRNKIVNDAINSVKLADDAVTNAKIAVDAIQGDVIAAGAITEEKINTGAISVNKLAANSVTAAKILANTITASQIAANTITASQILAGTITSAEILAGTIVASDIQSGTLTSASGVFGTISANDITTGTLNASNVDVTNLTATNISTGTLNANLINLNGSTLGVTSNGLNIASGGVSIAEIGTRAVGAMVVNSASTTAFGDGRSGDNFANLVTATFTTAEGGDYLIVGNCMVGGTFNLTTQLESRIVVGSTQVTDYQSPTGGAAIQPVVLAGKINLSANTSYTVALQGQVIVDNPAPSIFGFSSRISALKLNKQ